MNPIPTRNQMLALIVLASVSLVLALMPHWGSPHFRYTGSDPDNHVWNLGWPLAKCIYDSVNSPHFFVGPFAFIFACAGLVGFIMLYAVLIAWNHRGMLRTSRTTDAAH